MPIPSDSELKTRCALITGAGRGIGLAIARRLAGAGCAVAIQDIDQAIAAREAERIAAEIPGARAVALGGDATDLDRAEAWVGETVAKLGGLHILINNAAIQDAVSWLDMTRESIESQLRADFTLPILLCQRAVPILRRAGWGRIINIGSIQQRVGNPGMLAYAMCKAALDNMTHALGRELAGEHITVNLIAPGHIDATLRNKDSLDTEGAREKAAERIPAKRLGQPEDCAGLALLLCSEAGSYITGQSIYVDGGLSAR